MCVHAACMALRAALVPPAAVTTYSTATEALAVLKERTHDFDLVLSDVYMPGGWGRGDEQQSRAMGP